MKDMIKIFKHWRKTKELVKKSEQQEAELSSLLIEFQKMNRELDSIKHDLRKLKNPYKIQ
jgi:predicted  nucleic acid-binding Zn-ribbon protein